jgi:Zn-dependent protease with chaperone function
MAGFGIFSGSSWSGRLFSSHPSLEERITALKTA